MNDTGYKPKLDSQQVKKTKEWHDTRYSEMKDRKETDFTYLGLKLVVPPGVYPPRRTSHLLGEEVLKEVKSSDKVLDMGTGSGVNAILAASKSLDVTAVDVSPDAVKAAKENAKLNGVEERTEFFVSNVWENVEGKFDLIIFDPPFRWFAARDMLERSMADENYTALTSFFKDVREHLNDNGRVLLFFGTSGDLDYLKKLVKGADLKSKTLVEYSEPVESGWEVTYYTYKLT